MRSRLLFISIFLCGFWLQSLGQLPTIDAASPTVKGYDITISNATFEDATYYLTGNQGSEIFVLDQAVPKKGVLHFKNKDTQIPCGIYTISKHPDNQFFLGNPDTCLNVVLNLSNKMQAQWDGKSYAIESNSESFLLYTFLKRWGTSDAAHDPDALSALMKEFTETSPDALVSKYVVAHCGWYAHTGGRIFTCLDALKDLPYTNLSDPRMLYVPSDFNYYVNSISNCDINNSDSLIMLVDSVLKNCSSPVLRNYYTKLFFNKFDTHNPDYDPLLVHLYDQYDRSWIEEGNERRIERKIEKLRKLLPGAKIPELISHNKDGIAHSTNDIQTKYTVLWFWDPDCDHCQEMTPILHQMYKDYAATHDFEVFAVEVNEDHDRWVTFSDIHELWDWINLSTSMGEQNIDFIEYFDIMTTPVMFLIDNSQDHTIIARQITLDELREKLNINND